LSAAAPVDPAARPAAGGGAARAPQPAAAATWTAVVSTDRAYYDSVSAVNEQDTALISSFPGELPERRIPLTGAEVRIGRRSVSLGIEPEIDLTGPPRDPGVSRLHAKLVPAPDGGWTVVDLGTNGITVNGQDVPSGDSVPLRPGDHIHLGAWTKITITRG
jgi:pSer/pThr/pTyr-binding forkhead associated (FHA) protein